MYASSAVCGAAPNFTQIQASARVKLKLVLHETGYSAQRLVFMKGFGSMAKSFALLVSRSSRGRPVLLKGLGNKASRQRH